MEKKEIFYNKLANSLLNIIIEINELKNELDINEIDIVKGILKIGKNNILYSKRQYSNQWSFSCEMYKIKTKIINADAKTIFIYCKEALKKLKELKKQKEELNEILNFRLSYKKVLITEKYNNNE